MINFNLEYDRQLYINFFGNFLPYDFEIQEEEIEQERNYSYFKKITLIGTVDSLNLSVYEVYYNAKSEPRITLTRNIFRFMSLYGKSNALVLFVPEDKPNYRLSLVTLELKLKGKKTPKKFSNPRRFSFYLGPETKILTPTKLLSDRITDINDLLSRFSIEVVNKEFYDKIALLFTQLVGGKRKVSNKVKTYPPQLKLPLTDAHKKMQEFAIRLIGRVVFCWFLKKKKSDDNKPLIPEDILSSQAVKNNKNYYHNILEPLFFEILNREKENRIKKVRTDLYNKIPFLNGGLFEPNEDDFYRSDEFLRSLAVPDKWIEDLFILLETYNFTVDENTTVDIEIAVDPEMLGRIFENLLAEIDPITGETARKATGSYYTPRDIVEYMVDESLKGYLKQKTNLSESKLYKLLSYISADETDLNDKEKIEVIDALDKLKILDPACGSGAFPIGILQKMVLILQHVDPDSKLWFKKILNKIDNIGIRKSIEEKFKYEDRNYKHKLGIINHSIYGLDIQPLAVEIARLRCFLTLIVDQKIIDNKDNRGIQPLPNLDFKFICANSLISLPELKNNSKQLEMFDDHDTFFKEFEELTTNYFIASKSDEKLKFRNKIKNIINNKVKEKRKDIKEMKYLEKNKSVDILKDTINLWESYLNIFKYEKVNFFETKYFFPKAKNGFDIVIGNPPYIKEYTLKSAFDGLRNSPYYKGKMDIWYLFACKFLDILKDNTGLLTFIATNNWITNYGASIMRNKIIKDSKIEKLIDFGSYMIFESSDIQTMIMIFKKDSKTDNYKFDYRKLDGSNLNFNDVLDLIFSKKNINAIYFSPLIKKKNLIGKVLTFNNPIITSLLDKIESKSNFCLDGKREVANGIHSHHDYLSKKAQKILGSDFNVGCGIFALHNYEKNNIPFTQKELNLIKPLYTTRELFKYWGNPNNTEWIIYTTSKFKNPFNIKPYPNIKKHLDKFQKVITSDNKPYGLHRSREEYFFKNDKIIAVRKCLEPTFTFTDFDCYVSATFYVIKSERLNMKYLTGFLNSKLIKFWLKHKGKMQGNNYQIDKEPILNIPIFEPENTEPVVSLVSQIIYHKKKNLNFNTSNLEKQLDNLIYDFYKLTDEEIQIVENHFNNKNN